MALVGFHCNMCGVQGVVSTHFHESCAGSMASFSFFWCVGGKGFEEWVQVYVNEEVDGLLRELRESSWW